LKKLGLSAVLFRVGAFVAMCLLAMFALIASLAELRVDSGRSYHAEFWNVSALEANNFVRIAGVEVGKVQDIVIRGSMAIVTFTANDSVILTKGTKAVVRYDNLFGRRYLALEEGPGGTATLRPGETIPASQTAPALDLDALIGGFRPLFRALDPDQTNELTGQLIQAFQGQGDTINALLGQIGGLTGTLADRDQLIGEVIGNLNTVLGTLGRQSDQVDTTIDSLSRLVNGLSARRADIMSSLAATNASAATIADLLSQSRAPLNKVVHETDRSSGIIVADHDYVDGLLNTLPDTLKVIARQGLQGDWINLYLCDVYLKVNGKGGQPVYVKVAGQATGRCAPR
jgi:phospholipid/cholesterol/gamma-HCH transport system substrate-binding protein